MCNTILLLIIYSTIIKRILICAFHIETDKNNI